MGRYVYRLGYLIKVNTSIIAECGMEAFVSYRFPHFKF